MTELERTHDPVRLAALRSALDERGIRSFVFGAAADGQFGGAVSEMRMRLMVADDDAPQARRVILEAGLGSAEA